jgi:hypothetical protein
MTPAAMSADELRPGLAFGTHPAPGREQKSERTRDPPQRLKLTHPHVTS